MPIKTLAEQLKADWAAMPATDEATLATAMDKWTEREIAMREATPVSAADTLCKLEFAQWYAEAAASDDPLIRGVEAAIADLRTLTNIATRTEKARFGKRAA